MDVAFTARRYEKCRKIRILTGVKMTYHWRELYYLPVNVINGSPDFCCVLPIKKVILTTKNATKPHKPEALACYVLNI